MGRPKKFPKRISTAVRIKEELHDRLLVAAEERDLPMNWLINKAIEEYLDRLLPLNEIKWTRD